MFLKKELQTALKKFEGNSDSLKTLYAKMYMTAGFPTWCNESDFCAWMELRDPTTMEVVQYFMGERKKII